MKISTYILVLFVIAGCKSPSWRQHTTLEDNSELKRLVLIDQQMRENDTLDMEPVDRKHRKIVMELLANGKVRTNQDKFNAALILQHTALTFCNGKLTSISPENYLLSYQLVKSVFEFGDKAAGYMTAAAYDRYLLYTEGYQKYGTQRIIDDSTGEEVWAPIDPNTTDKERAKYSVPSLDELKKRYRVLTFPNQKH